MQLRLMSYNIRFGGHGREALIAEVVRAANPDLVVFQEATAPEVVAQVAQDTGMSEWRCKPAHSLAFMSRVPIADYSWHRPAGNEHPFVTIDLAPSPLRIFGVHLQPRLAKWNELGRVRELQALLKDIEPYRKAYHLLVGDFNTAAPEDTVELRRFPLWLRALIWFSGRSLHRLALQVLLNEGYIDAYRKLNPNKEGYTLPTPDPHIRLDYLFVPESFHPCLQSCSVLREPDVAAYASDHYPLLAVLDV